jgi:hypothetical protein
MLKPKLHFEQVSLEVVLKIANQAVLPKKEERTKAPVGRSPVPQVRVGRSDFGQGR